MGGAALLILALIAFFWLRRRSTQQAYERDQAGGYKNPSFSPAGPQPMPFTPNPINPHTPYTPYTPPTSGNRDTAPLMAHMNPMYSNNGGPVPNNHGISEFAPNNNAYMTNSGYQDNQTPAWAIPTAARQGSMDATNYTGSPSTPSAPLTPPGAGGTWSSAGIPPGAMAPRMGSIHGARSNEKARFTPSKPTLSPSSPATTVAPPPYSQGG